MHKGLDRRSSRGLLCFAVLSGLLSAALVVSSHGTTEERAWAWGLTLMQVAAMWTAGSGRRAGWLMGAAVQPAWITYALLTAQGGFILGCVVSAGVQITNYMRTSRASSIQGLTGETSPAGRAGVRGAST